jgi:hypothetical protein
MTTRNLSVERTSFGFPGGIILLDEARSGGWLIRDDDAPWLLHVTDDGEPTGLWTGPVAGDWQERLR